MANTIELSSKVGVTLDLILKSLVASSKFTQTEFKNWEALTLLIPGTTPTQCARRYEELVAGGSTCDFFNLDVLNKEVHGNQMSARSSETSCKENVRDVKQEFTKQKDSKEKEQVEKRMPIKETNTDVPLMVIHVCDEAKQLKEDFFCPRNLLVREMKYFQEYLTTDPQRWEDVDISVHCDVQIFDWLMRYVKRSTKEIARPPKLDSGNVISILISSDFLMMDSLVQNCIEYCHRNISSIVAAPSNLNCISEKLMNRIIDLFSHNEADSIKDKKDKFKSKLFSRKLKKLFDTDNTSGSDSPENASTLFRCCVCNKLLTQNLETKVKCLPSRMAIGKRGEIMYFHMRDSSFDITDYLLKLKNQLKYWRDVYWRIWGIVNYLACSRCGETFQCSYLGHCWFHPEVPQFDETLGQKSSFGIYPCCHQKLLRFDPSELNKGCRVRDHMVNLKTMGEKEVGLQENVYGDLLAHRDAICVPSKKPSDLSDQNTISVFANEECTKNGATGCQSLSLSSFIEEANRRENSRSQPQLCPLLTEKKLPDETFCALNSDDKNENADCSPKQQVVKKSKITIDLQTILVDAPEFQQKQKTLWNSQKSVRYNQDAQRQEDQRRMKEMKTFLIKLRLNPEKLEKPKKEYAGGMYSRLEAQWKTGLSQQAKTLSQPQLRNKPRLGQPKNTVS